MLATWKRVMAGIYEATNTEGNKYYITSGATGWNVHDDNQGYGVCGEYLFWARTLAEVKASL